MFMQEVIGHLRHMKDGSGFPVIGKDTTNTVNTGLPVIGEDLKKPKAEKPNGVYGEWFMVDGFFYYHKPSTIYHKL